MRRWIPLLLLLALVGPASLAGAHAATSSTPCMGLMVMVDPSAATMGVGGTQPFSAMVYCGSQGGSQNVTSVSTLDWSATGSSGTLAPATGPSTVFHATQNGSETVNVAAHYSGMSAAGSATVTVGSPPGGGNTSLTCMMLMASLTPSSSILAVGASQSFSASVACGSMGGMQDVTTTSNLTWSLSGSQGSLDRTQGPTATLTASSPGNATLWLVARYGTYHAETSAFLTVVGGLPPDSRSFTLSGEVTNLTGGKVPGATIQVVDPSAGAVTSGGVTGASGGFAFVLPGGVSYELRAIYPTGEVVESGPTLLTGNESLDLSLATHVSPISGGGTHSLPTWLILLVAGVGFSATFVTMVFGGEVAQLALLFPALLMYSRIKREQVLDHFQRGRIYGYVESHPGASYSDVLRALKLANGVASYHLFTLEREQFVVSRREGNFRRYYANKAITLNGETILSWIQDSILTLVRERPGINQSEIARHLGTRRQNVNYNVSRLQKAGMVRLEGWGLTKRCFIMPAIGEMGSPVSSPRTI